MEAHPQLLPPPSASAELRRVTENLGADATILGAFLCNTATVGTYRIQDHCQYRVKDVIESGKHIGRLNAEKYEPFAQDVELAVRTLHDTVERGRDALLHMRQCVRRLLMTGQEMRGAQTVEAPRGVEVAEEEEERVS